MAQNTPLLQNERSSAPYYALNANVQIEVNHDVEDPPMEAIVDALFSAWRDNGAHLCLDDEDIEEMSLQYYRVTRGRRMNYFESCIVDNVVKQMIPYLLEKGLQVIDRERIELKHNFLGSFRRNWDRIITYKERAHPRMDVRTPRMDVYTLSTCQERIQNFWMNCKRIYTVLKNSFALQVVYAVILLVWSLSLIVMGAKFMIQCQVDALSKSVLMVGCVGNSALLLRLVLACIHKFCILSLGTRTFYFRNAQKFLEFALLLLLAILLWIFPGSHPNFDSHFCNETFYSYVLGMKFISTTVAVPFWAYYLGKAIIWVCKTQICQDIMEFVDNFEIEC